MHNDTQPYFRNRVRSPGPCLPHSVLHAQGVGFSVEEARPRPRVEARTLVPRWPQEPAHAVVGRVRLKDRDDVITLV